MILEEKSESELTLTEPCDPMNIVAELRNHFPHLTVESRCRFRIASGLIPSLKSNVKETTIRYVPNAVDYPIACDLPVFEDTGGINSDLNPIGSVNIRALHYKSFGALSSEDAMRDGFSTLADLKASLAEFYGSIDDEEMVSIYVICLAPNQSNNTAID